MTTTTTRDPNALAEAHLPLVDQVVSQLANRFPRHVDRDELWGAGAVGLVDAANRYDPATGVPFPSYATIRIRGAIIDATRSRDWATRRLRRDLRSIEEASERLENRLQRRPDDEEVADELGIEAQVVRDRRAAALASALLTLDGGRTGDTGDAGPLSDRIVEDDKAWIPESSLEDNELVGTLRTAIEHLPVMLRQVLLERHFEGRRIRDIAADLGVTEARVSQLRQEAIHALQAFFATSFDRVPDVPDGAPGKRRRADFVARICATTTWRTRLDAATVDLSAADRTLELVAG